MKGIKQEMNIENLPIPVTIERTSIILKQLKYCICKIVMGKGHGTGFFVKLIQIFYLTRKMIFLIIKLF